MHRAAKAPCRRRPVSSTLDSRERQYWLVAAMRHRLLQLTSRLPRPAIAYAILAARSWGFQRLLRHPQSLQSQSLGLRPRRPSCFAVWHTSSRPAPEGGLRWSSQWGRPGRSTSLRSRARLGFFHQTGPAASLELSARRLRRNRLSNPTFNRSSNGWPPCPRGAVCLSCTSRARRPPVGARLTPR
jgi:hypothetical protein